MSSNTLLMCEAQSWRALLFFFFLVRTESHSLGLVFVCTCDVWQRWVVEGKPR